MVKGSLVMLKSQRIASRLCSTMELFSPFYYIDWLKAECCCG